MQLVCNRKMQMAQKYYFLFVIGKNIIRLISFTLLLLLYLVMRMLFNLLLMLCSFNVFNE